MATLINATVVSTAVTASSGISDCPLCVIVWLFLKKFAGVIIGILITAFVCVTIGLILFCRYRRKMRKKMKVKVQKLRGVSTRDKLSRKRSDSTQKQPHLYEELGTFGPPASIRNLDIPKTPDDINWSDFRGGSDAIVSQRDTHRLNPTKRDSYLTPSFVGISNPGQPAVQNPYSFQIGGMKSLRDPDYLHASLERPKAENHARDADGVNRPIWHTQG